MNIHIIDSESIDSLSQVHEALKAIFATRTLSEVQLNLAEKAIQEKVADIVTLSNFCLGEISKTQPGAAGDMRVRNEDLCKVLSFQTERFENANSYNPTTKPNPAAVAWPNPEKGSSVYDTDIYVNKLGLVDRETPVGSAGSCFAMEIAHWMQSNGFNYVVTEDNFHEERKTHWSCARWGTIFNTAAFRQLIERSFGVREVPNYLWRTVRRDGRQVYRDPFREEVEFDSIEEYVADFEKHKEAARAALSKVKVFIITLGLNEVWRFRGDGAVLSRNPWRIAPSYVSKKALDVEENVAELQQMLDVWRRFNPDIQLIVSVSPVPMLQTFRADEMHVMAATCLSKSTLRVAAQRFSEANKGVYYFPSFEKIMYGTKEPWEPDFRHVKPEAVDGVMRMFERTFVEDRQPSQSVPGPSFLKRIRRGAEYAAVTDTVKALSQSTKEPILNKLLDVFAAGYEEFAEKGKTPHDAYAAMRHLFTITNGVFNRIISDKISQVIPPLLPPVRESIFGNSMDTVLSGLRENGYWVFGDRLPSDVVGKLVEYAETKPAKGRAGGDKHASEGVYADMRKLGNTLFQFEEVDLVRSDDVWEIACMQEFTDVARAYLNCEPILDMVAMWWSLAVNATVQECSSAAQLYHFDLDRLGFLKFFVYLTDVTEQNGPHCYVAGSHKGLRSPELQRDGRFSDDEVLRHYPNEEVRILGKKGTIFVADTKGLHKGLPLTGGERLIFQLEFTNSLFGAPTADWDRRAKSEYEITNANLFAKMNLGTVV